MAIIKTIKEKIMTDVHMTNSIEYITKPSKAYKVSYNLCVNSTPQSLTAEFKNTRMAFNKDNKILGHQLVQSFSESDNITPETAHQIGLELMERCLQNYQVVMATHIDGNYIHNQFIINSVSPFDGKKFSDNKENINMIRRVSDELCMKYDLSIVQPDDKSKYIGIDAATLNLAKRGKSWKFQLIKDLDLALENCKTKDEFIDFFKKHNYEIRFTNANITFKKIGEEKGIRADTLAKQFGQKYCKASIEKKLNIKSEETESSNKYVPPTPQQQMNYYNQIAANEWKRFEYKYKNKIRINNKRYFNRILFARNPLLFTLRLISYIFSKSNKTAKTKIYPGKKNYFKVKQYTDYKNLKKVIGNIPYKTIISTPGEVMQIKLYSWQVAKLLHNNVLLSSKIDLQTGTAIITIKKTDLQKVSEVLNVSQENLFNQAKQIYNRKISYELKQKNKDLSYLVINSEQIEQLNYHCVKFASYPKGDKFNIAFAPTDKEKILSILYPNRSETNNNADTFFKRNSILNKQLKEKSKITREKLCYKVVFSNQYKALKKTAIEFAVFRQRDGKYNVVFLEHNKLKIEKAIRGESNVKSTVSNMHTQKNNNLKI